MYVFCNGRSTLDQPMMPLILAYIVAALVFIIVSFVLPAFLGGYWYSNDDYKNAWLSGFKSLLKALLLTLSVVIAINALFTIALHWGWI